MRIPRLSRLMFLAASVMLVALFALPLWRITLIAPQYPEGLGMSIRLATITGLKPHDLDNINGLNHYIGMRAIEPDSIPELKVMPWIVVALAVCGLAVAGFGRRRPALAWLAGFAAIGLAGMYDFWRWGYDYGHNLDAEHAIIKVPGMSYQPPLIGTKQLLNFTAASWPDIGGIVLGVAFALGVVAVIIAGRAPRPVIARRAPLPSVQVA